MKKIIAVLLAAVMMLAFFTGCGEKTGANGEVNVYNWGEYIDETVLSDFEKQTGIKVNYTTFPSNEAMYSVLETGGSNYDVIIPSDYMVGRLVTEGKLEKINFDNVPNYSLVDDYFKNQEYDPTGEYSVAYMSGTVGIIYNSKMVDEEITSWSALFDEKYSGQILMFDNSRDAMGIALKYLGYSLNTTSEKELNEAYEVLAKQRHLVQAYVMDQIFDKLESGEAAMGPYYAGDYVTMLDNNPDLRFVVPDEGANRFNDAMCIPKGAANKENAEAFINFMCSTEVSLKNMEYIGYTSVNIEAQARYAEELDDDIRAIIFPDESVLSRCEIFLNLPQETLDLYNALWVKLKA